MSYLEQTVGTDAARREGVGHPHIAAEHGIQVHRRVVAAFVVNHYQAHLKGVVLYRRGVVHRAFAVVMLVGNGGNSLVEQPFAVHYRADADIGEGTLQVLRRDLLGTHAHAGFHLGGLVHGMNVGAAAVVRTYVNRGRVLRVAVGRHIDGEVVVLTVHRRVVGRRCPCDVVARGVRLEGGVAALAVRAGVEDAQHRVVEDREGYPFGAVAARQHAGVTVRVATGTCQQLAVVAECGVVADGVVVDGLYRVALEQVQHHGAVAACGAFQQVIVVPGLVVGGVEVVINVIPTDGVVNMRYDGVVHVQVQVGDTVAALAVDSDVRVYARYVVCGAVEGVGVAVADGVVQVASDGVLNGEVYVQYAVAVVEILEVLTIPARGVVSYIVVGECVAGAYRVIYGVAERVANNEVDMQYAVATLRCAELLSVPARYAVRHSVPAEHLTGAYPRLYGVADGVVDIEVDDVVVEAVGTGVAEPLLVLALYPVGLVVNSDSLSRANGLYYRVAQGVVHMQMYRQETVAMHRGLQYL